MNRRMMILSWVAVFAAAGLQGATWLTDLPAAQAQAKREGKSVLINFTGSDWCGWCIKLKNEVFSQPEFDAFAVRHVVLVEIDFPKRKPLPPAVQKANQELAQKYGIKGFPTLVYLNSQGNDIGRGGYLKGGAKPFVQHLAKAMGVSYDPSAPGPAPAGSAPALPLYGGAKLSPPPEFKELKLQGISGSKNRRFALINHQTLAPGESTRVRLGGADVRVHCVEIREKSVVVRINNDEAERELLLD